ncbi:hypothetical protein D3C86_1892600 [compost metagenome]
MEGLRMEMLGRLGHIPTHKEMYEGQIKFMKGAEYFTHTGQDLVASFGEKLFDAFKAYAETASGFVIADEVPNADAQ